MKRKSIQEIGLQFLWSIFPPQNNVESGWNIMMTAKFFLWQLDRIDFSPTEGV